MKDKKLGFIDVGQLAQPMVAHLLDQGYEALIHNRRREPLESLIPGGAVYCQRPEDAVVECGILFNCLPDGAAVLSPAELASCLWVCFSYIFGIFFSLRVRPEGKSVENLTNKEGKKIERAGKGQARRASRNGSGAQTTLKQVLGNEEDRLRKSDSHLGHIFSPEREEPQRD